MTYYLQLAYIHLATVIPAFILGTFLIALPKGTPPHRFIGKVYMLLMLFTATITLFMSAEVGPTLLNHFGYIHIFSIIVFYTVPAAYYAARRGNIRAHKGNMIGLYIGGLLIAGTFAFSPGRLLHTWLFMSNP